MRVTRGAVLTLLVVFVVVVAVPLSGVVDDGGYRWKREGPTSSKV